MIIKSSTPPRCGASTLTRVREAYPEGFDEGCCRSDQRTRWRSGPTACWYGAFVSTVKAKQIVRGNQATGFLLGIGGSSIPGTTGSTRSHYILTPDRHIFPLRGGREVERLQSSMPLIGKCRSNSISMVCVRPDGGEGSLESFGHRRHTRWEVKKTWEPIRLNCFESQPVPWQLHDCWGGGLKVAASLGLNPACVGGVTQLISR